MALQGLETECTSYIYTWRWYNMIQVCLQSSLSTWFNTSVVFEKYCRYMCAVDTFILCCVSKVLGWWSHIKLVFIVVKIHDIVQVKLFRWAKWAVETYEVRQKWASYRILSMWGNVVQSHKYSIFVVRPLPHWLVADTLISCMVLLIKK